MAGYYDRLYPVERTTGGKATGFLNYGGAGVGPHVATVRWTYTVPSGSAAELESALAAMVRDAASPGAAQSFITVYPSGGGHYIILYDYAIALGTFLSRELTRLGFLRAGESVSAQTADAAAGGTKTYHASLRYREFPV